MTIKPVDDSGENLGTSQDGFDLGLAQLLKIYVLKFFGRMYAKDNEIINESLAHRPGFNRLRALNDGFGC